MTTPSARTLLEWCLHQDSARVEADRLPPQDSTVWSDLSALAASQRVRPLLFRAVQRRGLEARMAADVRDGLARAHRETTMRNLRLYAELAQVARTLAARGVPVLVLKGAHLGGEVYRDVGIREMNDLDVLVRVEHLPAAVEVLHERGYRPLHPFTIESDVAVHHHLTRFVKPHVAGIEIHWNITPPHTPRAIDPADLWSRAAALTIAGVPVRALCPVDLLLHLCFHASFQHKFQFGLRPFCDIAATIDAWGADIDWEALVGRARGWNWTRGVYLALRLARDIVGARVPADALRQLAPADFDDELLDIASTLVFSEPMDPVDADTAGVAGITVRFRRLAGLTLRLRRRTAARHPAGFRASAMGWYYVLRPTELRRRLRMVARLLLNRDQTLRARAERANHVLAWMRL